MRLLFHKNRKRVTSGYKDGGGPPNCPCWEQKSVERCLHPESPTISVVKTGFKDEPGPDLTVFSCPYQRYWGPNSMAFSEITRAEYEEIIRKNTFCLHPGECLPAQVEYRCYKCDAVVDGERTRHNCELVVPEHMDIFE